MLYTELEAAVHAMIQRLEYSFTFNPSLLTIPKRKPVSYTHLGSLMAKQRRAGWYYLMPGTVLITIMSFIPIINGFLTSLKTGSSASMKWASPLTYNYTRMFKDALFLRSMGNTFLYLVVEVPIMLILAILLAQLLNNHDLKFKGFFRTCVFLPCATSLVSYSLIFKSCLLYTSQFWHKHLHRLW